MAMLEKELELIKEYYQRYNISDFDLYLDYIDHIWGSPSKQISITWIKIKEMMTND